MIEKGRRDWLPNLKKMWQEAFGDQKETIEAFYHTLYQDKLTWCWVERNQVVSVIYGIEGRIWMNETGESLPVCYLYAGATDCQSRGRGYYKALLQGVLAELLTDSQMYKAVLLVPAKGLEQYYTRLGFQTVLKEEDKRYSVSLPVFGTHRDNIKRKKLSKEYCFPYQKEVVDSERYWLLRRTILGKTGYVEWNSSFLDYAVFLSVQAGGGAYTITENGQKFLMMYEIMDDCLRIIETTLTGTALLQLSSKLAHQNACREILIKGAVVMAAGRLPAATPYFRIALD